LGAKKKILGGDVATDVASPNPECVLGTQGSRIRIFPVQIVVQNNVEQYIVMEAELGKLLPLSATPQDGQRQSNDSEDFLK